jgi:PAS domain S-box-containing protein
MKKNGVIVNVNDMACKIYQTDREKLVGMNAGELFNKDHKCNMARIFPDILRGPSAVFEIPCKEANGKATFLEISVQHLTIGDDEYILTISRDITERKLYQEQLVYNQKMDSIAAFAGGIAHDVRNIITSMIAYIEMVKNDKGVSERTLNRTNLLDKSINNAGNMISQLLAFAKKSKSAKAESSLNDVVCDTINIIASSIGDNIEIMNNLWHENLVVQVNMNQIETVIMNIVFNARDAMPDGGRIIITTEAVTISQNDDTDLSNIASGKYAVLSIKDTGHGISEENQSRIFEPFFTSKEQGTGLGLAMVRSIVSEHEGYITVDSKVGKGSLFKIFIPLVTESRPADVSMKTLHKTVVTSLPMRSDAQYAKTGSILFVDDDSVLLTMMSDALEAQGYKVIPTINPHDAVELVHNDTGEINLVITDMAMPKMNGSELIQRVRSIRPKMKVILISAISPDEVKKSLNGTSISAILHKPFSPTAFLTSVNSIHGERQ